MGSFPRAVLVLLLVHSLESQEKIAPPAILPHGVVNAASRMPPDLAGGSIARRSVFTILGVRLGPETPALGEVKVDIARGDETMRAEPVFASRDRIDAIMPADVPLGRVSVTVSYAGQTSLPYSLNVVAASFGIFTRNGRGWGPAVIHGDRVKAGEPLRRGDTVAIEGTGLGGAANRDVEVLVGGQRASRVTSAEMHEARGRELIHFRIPKESPLGCWVPIVVRLGGASSNTATLPVSPKGAGCETPDDAMIREIALGGSRGLILLLRTRIVAALGASEPQEFVSDEFDAFFRKLGRGTGPPSLIELLPPAGTCTSYGFSMQLGKLIGLLRVGDALPRGDALDAGDKLILSGEPGAHEIGKEARHRQFFSRQMGGRAIGAGRPTPLFFAPGEYVVAGAGGQDVGPFRASIEVPPSVIWTNDREITEVDRARGVTLHWSGAVKEERIAILGMNLDQSSGATAVSVCMTEPGSQAFTVPPSALSNFPVSRQLQGIPSSLLGMVVIPRDVQRFSATGLDGGMAAWIAVNFRAVPYR